MKMKMKNATLLICAGLALTFTACDKDDAVVIPPASTGLTTTLSGGAGGSVAANSVFVDFSTDKVDSVARASWDLGFYAGTDFRVVINNTTAATAKVINKTDLTQVNASDTTGFADAMIFANGVGSLGNIDDVTGDLTKTVISAISATDADNKVYILKPTNGAAAPARDWYKIRIIRNGANYKLQYAKLSETAVKTIDVVKDATYNFNYVSLETNAVVKVEPAKASWDIEWTYTSYLAGPTIPYPTSDFVYINSLGGVTAAEVLTSRVSYATFADTSIAATNFSSSKIVIGSNWRATTGTIGVKTDRFYVVKDAAGNVYKLRFISFHASDGGIRGYPKIEYTLVKKA
jgi:hypothetical protein